ncbi:MAG TPA: SRPBCC family protein [Acidimicrobiia bacterium]|nr:SRPBCC family protein [Acidimicrobiia bacterium]
MATLRREVRIARPADAVWDVIADAGTIADWFPAMESSSIEGDVRRCSLRSGLELIERIVTSDAELRRFQYRVTGGVPVIEHLATVDVFALGPADALLVYSTEVEPAPLALVLGDAIEEAVLNLRARLEGSDQ